MLAAWRTLKVTQQEQWALQSHRSRGRRFLCGESRGSCLSESLVTQTTFDLEALTFNIYHRVSSVWIWFLSQTPYHRLGINHQMIQAEFVSSLKRLCFRGGNSQ